MADLPPFEALGPPLELLICTSCGALVLPADDRRHEQWHKQEAERVHAAIRDLERREGRHAH